MWNPFGAAKKLRAETQLREAFQHDLEIANESAKTKDQEIESLKSDVTHVERTLDDAADTATTQAKRIEGLTQELAEAPFRAMEELVGLRGIRIGYRDFDLINIQSAARAVDPSIRIERENFRWVFYADKVLEQAQMNRLESKIGFRLERG